jgi:hypothetical protein
MPLTTVDPASLVVLGAGICGACGSFLFTRLRWTLIGLSFGMFLLGEISHFALTKGLLFTHPLIVGTVAVAYAFWGYAFSWHRIWGGFSLWRQRQAISDDLQRGDVARFCGATMDAVNAGAVARARLVTVDVLRRSGLVVSINGCIVSELVRIGLVNVAAAQPYAFQAPLPHELLRVEGMGATAKRRGLSHAESDELERHIRSLRRRFGPSVVAATIVVAMLALQLRERADLLLHANALGWYVFAGFTFVDYVRRRWVARKLERDRSLRWVVTLTPKSATESVTPPRLEVLPVSQLAWTEGGRPAGWRRRPL